MAPIRRKLVIVGDGGCGKTSLRTAFCTGETMETCPPTVLDTYVADIVADGKRVVLSMVDTAGQDAYDQLRPLLYSGAHVILICFSIDSPDSLDNITEKWEPEMRRYCPGVPFILVGNKKDLRNNPHEAPQAILPQQGHAVAERINATAYMECSAKNKDGVNEVFTSAAKLALKEKKRGKSKCVLH